MIIYSIWLRHILTSLFEPGNLAASGVCTLLMSLEFFKNVYNCNPELGARQIDNWEDMGNTWGDMEILLEVWILSWNVLTNQWDTVLKKIKLKSQYEDEINSIKSLFLLYYKSWI